MTLKQLSILTGRRYQYLLQILNKAEVGQVYVKGAWNLNALKKSLHKWYTESEFEDLAGVAIDEITLEKVDRNASTQRDYVDVEDLKVGSEYVIRNYHYESVWTLMQIVGTIYLFKNGTKVKAIDTAKLESHTKFIEVED